MRLDVHVVDVQPTATLKEYTQRRLWLGLQENAHRILCAGLWLSECAGGQQEDGPRFVCRIDVWLRRIGHVTVRHVESNPFVAVELAVARMRHKVSGRVRRALRATARAGAAHELQDGGERARAVRARRQGRATPRFAVVVERRGPSAASSAAQWLSRNIGVEQLARLTVSNSVWAAAADGDHDRLESLRGRLSLSLLGRPMLLVILGSAAGRSAEAVDPVCEQARIRALVDVIREWALPVEVMGLWIDRDGEPEHLVEPHEVPTDRELDERLAVARRAWKDDDARHLAPAHDDREELVPCE
jgi:hypothetical protein